MKKVSVIIPVYESEKYLRDCLESVVKQNMDDVEVLCVYDESTDTSLDILCRYREKYDFINIIYSPHNAGLSTSRNRGLSEAKGKYIQFLDSDDFLEKDMLRVLYETAEQWNTEIVYLNKRIVYEDNWKREPENQYEGSMASDDVCTGRDLFVRYMKNGCMKSVNAYTQFFSRRFLEKNELRFRDGIIYEDIHFFFFCAMNAQRVFDLDLPLYIYRRHDDCGSIKETELHEKSMFTVFMDIWSYWKNHSFTEEENKAIEQYVNNCYLQWKNHFETQWYYRCLQNGSPAEMWMYRWFTGVGYCDFSATDLERINDASHRYIYGAGLWGKEVFGFLQSRSIGIDAFVVSDRTKRVIVDEKVICIDELNVSKDSLFIIAARNSREKIRDILMKKGYKNYIYGVK